MNITNITQVSEIVRFWREHGLTLVDEEGFRFGPPDVALTGIVVSWLASVAAIEAAAAHGCNLLVVHEDLLYPPGYTRQTGVDHLSGRVNTRRLALLARHGLTVFRAHATLDAFCILNNFVTVLGLPEPAVREGWVRVCEVPPTTARALAEQARQRLGLPHVRVVGDMDRTVRRVGLPWGGMCLSYNAGFQEKLLASGADVLIAGEVDDYAMHAMLDAGVPLIETGHAASEDPGLRHFADALRAFLGGGVPVHFHATPRPWSLLA